MTSPNVLVTDQFPDTRILLNTKATDLQQVPFLALFRLHFGIGYRKYRFLAFSTHIIIGFSQLGLELYIDPAV